MQYWEEASLAALEEIYSVDGVIGDLESVRLKLDAIIDDMWVQHDGDSDKTRHAWKMFGATARQLGRGMGFSIFSTGPGPVHDIVCRKQRDYGHNNISRFGRQGLMVRLHDKVARLENLLSSGRRPNNESIEDNIVDLIGYSCIGMMWEEGTFLLACYGSTVAESDEMVSLPGEDVFTRHSVEEKMRRSLMHPVFGNKR